MNQKKLDADVKCLACPLLYQTICIAVGQMSMDTVASGTDKQQKKANQGRSHGAESSAGDGAG